ncbi:phage tail protein, partial [Salinivibrio sp. VYel6]|uniref:phage tail protein n=1 Tax=Salinivibrio sp. VYel6 TaxID=2490493 RepID=UPI0015626642
MLKPTEFTSVQPENRTTLEEALEFAWHAVIAAAECPYPNLKQPQLTNADFVSLLAEERGVLDWQPNDTLTQRRDTTDKAFAIHSKAGTRSGLKEALDVLGFESRVTRGDLPYSIDVSAEIETGSLDEALQQ